MYPAADITAALKANPEACAEVLDALIGRPNAEDWQKHAERERDEARRELLRKVSHDDDCALVQAPGQQCTCADVGRKLRQDLATERAAREKAERVLGEWGADASRYQGEASNLRARLDACEKVVEAAWPAYADNPCACGDCIACDLGCALRAYDAHKQKAKPVPEPAEDCEHEAWEATVSGGRRCADCGAAISGLAPPRDPADLTEPPLTRADLAALEERIVERALRSVAGACRRADSPARVPWPWPLTQLSHVCDTLADELRRRRELRAILDADSEVE